MKILRFRYLVAIALGFCLVNTIQVDSNTRQAQVQLGWEQAEARSSGARGGGGSFRSSSSSSSRSSSSSSSSSRSSSSSSSSSRSSSSSSSSSRSSSFRTRPSSSSSSSLNRSSKSNSSFSNRSYTSPANSSRSLQPVPRTNPGSYNSGITSQTVDRVPAVVPVPVAPPAYVAPSETDNAATEALWIVGLVFLCIGGTTLLLFYLMYRLPRTNSLRSDFELNDDFENGFSDLIDESVTVSKIQVALLAQAHEVQEALTNLTLAIDTESHDGLYQLLQESALVLLRSPENWSHVLASSQTFKTIEAAEANFSQNSITERSKFSVETLTNVNGHIRKQAYQPDPDEEPASYIVVTLLVGSAHDHSLFEDIRDSEALVAALQQIAAMPPDYLKVFELLWSPQAASDSLTYEELLTEYTEMVQL